MRVLHIASGKVWRGGENQVFQLIKEQKKEIDSVFFVGCQEGPLFQKLASMIPTHAIQFSPFYLWSSIKKLNAFINKYEIDLIHVHDSTSHTLVYIMSLFNSSIPIIVHRRFIKKPNITSYFKYRHPAIKAYIAVSNAVAKSLSPPVKSRFVKTIYSGIVPIAKNSASQKIKQYGDPNDTIISYVAAFTDEKDHLTFFKIAQELLKNKEKVHFVLVGEGPLLNKMKLLVGKYQSAFTFTGFMSDVAPILNQTDILLHTSKNEALGTSILEAFSHGIPVVAKWTGGIPEIIQPEYNGFLFNQVNEAVSYLKRLINNSDLKTKMSSQAKNSSQKYRIEEINKQVIKLYLSILDQA